MNNLEASLQNNSRIAGMFLWSWAGSRSVAPYAIALCRANGAAQIFLGEAFKVIDTIDVFAPLIKSNV